MSEVPCNGCTACCKSGDIIFLKEGDNPDDYDTIWTIHRKTGIGGLALKKKPNGHCIYLTDTGCSIHGRAPVVCKEFDCRKAWRDYLSLPRPQRRRLMKELQRQHLFGGEIVAAAKARLHTLEE